MAIEGNTKMSNQSASGDLLGHPKGLFVLFGTEMWERMSYYGLRGIFILYLTSTVATGAFGWSAMSESEVTANALSFLGTFMFMVYVTPVIGGWLADNNLGQRKAIIIGGLLMAMGQFALAVPYRFIEGFELAFLYLGMILLIIGNGFFKPNISTMVGDLYQPGDHRRDQAFTIFYMGINVGSTLGFLVVGTIGEKVDYQMGFMAAGVGMLLSLMVQLWFGDKYLGDLGKKPSAKANVEAANTPKAPLTPVEKDRIKAILMLSFFTVFFFMGFEQAAGAMTLFAKNHTDLSLFGWEMPASWLQVVNPIFVVLLAPVMGKLWMGLGKNDPSTPKKFSMGMVFLGAGFVVMVGAAMQISDGSKAAIWWLVVMYILHTIGELCLSPIGLSMVTKLSPVRYVSFMMGMWFFFTAMGSYLAAVAGMIVGEAGPLATFAGVSGFCLAAGLALYLLSDKIVMWMHGADDEEPESAEGLVVAQL
ncbi:MAG: POT family proton-dependent oligopeptide transporter [Phenylobacterium sp.]|jgi:POT family proton-dependent oligopeptide transporter